MFECVPGTKQLYGLVKKKFPKQDFVKFFGFVRSAGKSVDPHS